MIFNWSEISNVPNKPGVYAWYYRPEITDFDLEETIKMVKHFKADERIGRAMDTVREFLDNTIFHYFKEDPYFAILRGPLKPMYEGTIEHKPSISDDLLRRIVEEPERLITIKTVLEASAPSFASPLYIGMAEILKDRLSQHKKLIERYRQQNSGSSTDAYTLRITEKRDHSFARQICYRNIVPTQLFTVVMPIDTSDSRYVDIENILNRIHYPLLGRN